MPMLAQGGGEVLLVAVAIGLLCVLALLAFTGKYIVLYMRARRAGAPVKVGGILLMLLHGVDPVTVVSSYITAVQGGVSVGLSDLEVHCLARGDVPNLVAALVAARRAGLPLSYLHACMIDLAGGDPLEAVRTARDARVCDCPDAESGYDAVCAAAGDGVELKARAQVTVHTNLARLVGGAKEPTVMGAVADAVGEVMEAAETHEAVLNDPDAVAAQLMAMGLDADAACEIESIEVEIKRASSTGSSTRLNSWSR